MLDDASLHLSDRLPFPRRFPSSVDWWLAVLLIVPALLVGIVVALGALPAHPALWAIALLQVFVLWILTRTFYEVTREALLARSGPFRWTIPLASIRSMSATRNPLSSPALSLDRIRIEHAGGRLMVSPRDKAAFVRAVLTLAPAVSVSGLPGAADSTAADEPPSTFNSAAVVPVVALAAIGLAVGAWLLYAGTRAPDVTVAGGTLSIGGLYSTTVSRQDVVRIAIRDRVTIGRKLQGFDGGRYRRGFFDVEGLGRCRVFVARDATPFLVIHTKTQPIVINFDDPARTHTLHDELSRAWQLVRQE